MKLLASLVMTLVMLVLSVVGNPLPQTREDPLDYSRACQQGHDWYNITLVRNYRANCHEYYDCSKGYKGGPVYTCPNNGAWCEAQQQCIQADCKTSSFDNECNWTGGCIHC
ncbi:hypothetical protein EJ08DRAFT_730862 [Tothia fuscella]|uniref:Chitin-binding type-2 domain-containing protein n=1 Tax=Tothia fuscella TaxID=1048955 RepID=A0A9P4U2M0_9PEZI|nr:hypothetical protein EJ08DRAFT_730862 [Tothia fuscella]